MRLLDWEPRLARVIDANRTTPFAWGTHDCAMFVGRCVEAVTGANPAAAFVETYSDEEGAERTLADIGGLATHCERLFGEPVPLLCARRGDVLYRVDAHGAEMVAVCFGAVGLVPGDTFTLHNAKVEHFDENGVKGRRVVGGDIGPTPWLVQFPLRHFKHAYRVG